MAPHDLPKQQLPGGVVGIDAAQIKIEAGHTYHYLYSAVHRAHKEAPEIWTIQECTRIMTSIMAAKPFSWRVVGITEAALKKFSEFDFRYKSGAGITRAHLKPRIETVRTLLAPSEPLSEVEFLNINDTTVLCVSGENKTRSEIHCIREFRWRTIFMSSRTSRLASSSTRARSSEKPF